jgi:hypothetical protein
MLGVSLSMSEVVAFNVERSGSLVSFLRRRQRQSSWYLRDGLPQNVPAVTRARNLFWLGILKADADTYRSALTGHTFMECQYDAQLDLSLASNL